MHKATIPGIAALGLLAAGCAAGAQDTAAQDTAAQPAAADPNVAAPAVRAPLPPEPVTGDETAPAVVVDEPSGAPGASPAPVVVAQADRSIPAENDSTTPDAAVSPEDAAVDALEAYLRDVTTLRAAFVQTRTDELGEVVDESSGQFALSRPGRFRWDYQEPVEQLILADGKALWMYDPDLESANVRALDDSLAANPAMLLSGQGQLRDGYDVAGTVRVEETTWIELAPKVADGDFRSVRLALRDGQITHMELTDSLGSVTRIAFSEIVSNPDIDDSTFVFTPPPGVDVIGSAGQ